MAELNRGLEDPTKQYVEQYQDHSDYQNGAGERHWYTKGEDNLFQLSVGGNRSRSILYPIRMRACDMGSGWYTTLHIPPSKPCV